MTDQYPTDTYIDIYDKTNNNEIAYFAPGRFTHNGTRYRLRGDLDKSSCYWIYMEDTFGDGLCCSSGSGWYQIYWNGKDLNRLWINHFVKMHIYNDTDIDAIFQ